MNSLFRAFIRRGRVLHSLISESRASKQSASRSPAAISASEILEETERFQRLSATPSYESVDSGEIRSDSRVSRNRFRVRRCRKPQPLTTKIKVARYRERLRASGAEEVLLQLPRETIALLDELKERQGLRNRSLALMQLIERGREATQ